MKKPLKRVLKVVGVFAGLLLVLLILFIIRFSSLTKQMTPEETMALNDTVLCIKDRFVNAYLFKSGNGYLMVDAGMSEKKVLGELRKLGVDPSEVTNLLLTHSDGDHIGATGALKNATVYMHRDEEQMINGETAKDWFKYRWKFGEYILLDSDEVKILNGLTVKVFHTPGHTPGSCCFAINDDYLVTGDNLSLSNGGYTHFIESFNMDTPLQEESLKSLPGPENFRYLLTAHGGVIKLNE